MKDANNNAVRRWTRQVGELERLVSLYPWSEVLKKNLSKAKARLSQAS